MRRGEQQQLVACAPTTTATYGTNGGSNFDRDGLSEPTVSSSSTIVSKFAYDDAGRQFESTDPRGNVTHTHHVSLLLEPCLTEVRIPAAKRLSPIMGIPVPSEAVRLDSRIIQARDSVSGDELIVVTICRHQSLS